MSINNVPEVLRFTISNVQGLGAGQSLQLSALLSQNPQRYQRKPSWRLWGNIRKYS